MKYINLDRILELIVDKVITRDGRMHSLYEKQCLLQDVKSRAYYDSVLRFITCGEQPPEAYEDIPAYPFLLLEELFMEATFENIENNRLNGWILWCFDSLEQLMNWLGEEVQSPLDINRIEAIYMQDLNLYKEIPFKCRMEYQGNEMYISSLDDWNCSETDAQQRKLIFELMGVATVHYRGKELYYWGYTVKDICYRIYLNECSEYFESGSAEEECGHFTYEEKTYCFVFCRQNGYSEVCFFNPDGIKLDV